MYIVFRPRNLPAKYEVNPSLAPAILSVGFATTDAIFLSYGHNLHLFLFFQLHTPNFTREILLLDL